MTVTDALWGGQLMAFGFDPVTHCLTLQIDVLDRGARTNNYLVCSGVSEFRFTNSIPDPWTYAEVTEAHTSQTPAGKWTVELLLWSEDCELVVTCDALTMDEGA